MHTYNELCDTWSSQDEVHIHDVKMTGDLPGSGRQHVYIYCSHVATKNADSSSMMPPINGKSITQRQFTDDSLALVPLHHLTCGGALASTKSLDHIMQHHRQSRQASLLARDCSVAFSSDCSVPNSLFTDWPMVNWPLEALLRQTIDLYLFGMYLLNILPQTIALFR